MAHLSRSPTPKDICCCLSGPLGRRNHDEALREGQRSAGHSLRSGEPHRSERRGKARGEGREHGAHTTPQEMARNEFASHDTPSHSPHLLAITILHRPLSPDPWATGSLRARTATVSVVPGATATGARAHALSQRVPARASTLSATVGVDGEMGTRRRRHAGWLVGCMRKRGRKKKAVCELPSEAQRSTVPTPRGVCPLGPRGS